MSQGHGAARSHPTRACANCSAVNIGVVEGAGGEVKFSDSGMIWPLALGVLPTGLALFARRFGLITYSASSGWRYGWPFLSSPYSSLLGIILRI